MGRFQRRMADRQPTFSRTELEAARARRLAPVSEPAPPPAKPAARRKAKRSRR